MALASLRFSRSLPARFHQATGRSQGLKIGLLRQTSGAEPGRRSRISLRFEELSIFSQGRNAAMRRRRRFPRPTGRWKIVSTRPCEPRHVSETRYALSTLSGGDTPVSRWRHWFLPNPISCCWTNRQITSMARGAVSSNPSEQLEGRWDRGQSRSGSAGHHGHDR